MLAGPIRSKLLFRSYCEFIFHEVPALIFSFRFTDLQEENIDGKLISSGYYVAKVPEPQRNEIALVNQSTCEHSIASNFSSTCSTSDESDTCTVRIFKNSASPLALKLLMKRVFPPQKEGHTVLSRIRTPSTADFLTVDAPAPLFRTSGPRR